MDRETSRPLWLNRETLEGRRQVRGWWWYADGVQPWLDSAQSATIRASPQEPNPSQPASASTPLGQARARSWTFRAEGRP